MAALDPIVRKTFGEGTNKPGLHALVAVGPSRGKYIPGEEPQYIDKRGPTCYEGAKYSPQNPISQYPNGVPLKDGSKPPTSIGATLGMPGGVGPTLFAPASAKGSNRAWAWRSTAVAPRTWRTPRQNRN
jgi:hypothetical protein